MKKTFIIFLALIFLTSSTISLANQNSQDDSGIIELDTVYIGIEGSWYLEAAQIGDSQLDMEITIIIKEDGTAQIIQGDETIEATWYIESDGIYIAEEGENPSRLEITDDGTLMWITESGMFVFGRIPPKVQEIIDDGPPIERNASIKAFDGFWSAFYIVLEGGLTVFFSELGPDAALLFEIKNGKVVSVNGLPVLEEVNSYYTNSSVVVYNPLVGTTHVFNLRVDGTLSMWQPGYEYALYCIKD